MGLKSIQGCQNKKVPPGKYFNYDPFEALLLKKYMTFPKNDKSGKNVPRPELFHFVMEFGFLLYRKSLGEISAKSGPIAFNNGLRGSILMYTNSKHP